MSTEQSVDPELVEQTKQQIRNLVREIAQIAKSDIGPQEFYDAVLNRIVVALAAVGGAVWTITESGQLALEYQINLRETRLAESEEDQVRHGRLLRKVISSGEGMLMAPHSGAGGAEEGANPTDFLLVMGPLKSANETAGVLEIFQRPGSSPTVQRGYLRFLLQMCELASEYLKSRKLQHFTDRQALWAQLENFTRLVHLGLDQRATAYTIANEGRRLIECDRVSVAINRGRKCVIEAISGQDTFDKRSNTVTLLNRLANAVVATGETVWYTGDTSAMAPQVEEAVQEYVDECHSKAVAVVPLKEPHDTTDPLADPKVLGALIIEQIEDSRPREGLPQRIEVVSNHSSIALANAIEHHDLFLMPVWRAVGKSRWVIEARQLPWTIAALVALVAVTAVLFLWPADFELSAKGKLQPTIRREVFADMDGEVVDVLVKHKDWVKKDQVLAKIRNTDLEVKIAVTRGQLEGVMKQLDSINSRVSDRTLDRKQKAQLLSDQAKLQEEQTSAQRQLNLLEEKKKQLTVLSPIDGQITTWDVDKTLFRRSVQLGSVLMRVVEPKGDWELEILMPEDRMGFINEACRELKTEQLPVHYITQTNPGVTHEGNLAEIHHTAEIRGEEGNTVLLRVAINKDDVPDRRDAAAVTAKVYCGRTSLGYAWFHDLVSFVQSKILFRLF
ncbi:MAG TPA: HlyD family efflux transporter periplasmic adaptor subunit [Pirellulales bacterium]|jgi:multidrug resistance efflux pump